MIYYLSAKQQQRTVLGSCINQSCCCCCMLHDQLGQLYLLPLLVACSTPVATYAIRVADPLVKILANRYFSHPNWL